LAKTMKTEKILTAARELGIVSTLASQLSSPDPIVAASSAFAIGAVALNDTNLVDFVKLGVLDILFRHIQGEDRDSKRESMGALASFSGNSKIRTKVRTSPEYLGHIIKQLSCVDGPTIVNTCHSLLALSEDNCNKTEVLKQGAVPILFSVLNSTESKVQAAACLLLSKLLQEDECQSQLSKNPKVISRLVEILSSKDLHACQNAAYTLSIASKNDENAGIACSSGAIHTLIGLSVDSSKRSKKFAADSLERILNYDLPAKYWLVNHLSPSNMIKDGFYDMGSVGTNLENVGVFPVLDTLKEMPVNSRREILLVDSTTDPKINQMVSYLNNVLPGKSTEIQLKIVAMVVSTSLGGSIESRALSDYKFKFKISEKKIELSSNIISIGSIENGTFYHRALLFKTLCDRIRLEPCSLVRGEYNRAWNVIDVKNVSFNPETRPTSVKASTGRRSSNKSSKPPSPALKLDLPDVRETQAETYEPEAAAIIDLMFDPGRLLPVGSNEAIQYQREFA